MAHPADTPTIGAGSPALADDAAHMQRLATELVALARAHGLASRAMSLAQDYACQRQSEVHRAAIARRAFHQPLRA